MSELLLSSLGLIRWRRAAGGKKATITSDKVIAVIPVPLPCPEPEPVEPPPAPPAPDAGWGLYGSTVQPELPISPGAAGAGISHNTLLNELTFNGLSCAEGPDFTVRLDNEPPEWSTNSLSAHIACTYQDTAGDQSWPHQSLWIGLETADGQDGIYVGLVGQRDNGDTSGGWGVYIMSEGVIILDPQLLVGEMDPPTPGQIFRLILRIYPVGGGTAGRRAISLSRSPAPGGDPDGWTEANTAFNSMDPLLKTQWDRIAGLLEAGELRPVLKVTQRDGGPVAGGSIRFDYYRWS